MLFLNYKKCIVFVTIVSFLMTMFILPTNGYAKWRSDPPPDEGISTTTLVLIGIGTVVLVYLIVSSSNSDEIPDESDRENKEQNETKTDSLKTSFNIENLNTINELNNVEQFVLQQGSDFYIVPILELQNEPAVDAACNKSINNLGIKVGLSFYF